MKTILLILTLCAQCSLAQAPVKWWQEINPGYRVPLGDMGVKGHPQNNCSAVMERDGDKYVATGRVLFEGGAGTVVMKADEVPLPLRGEIIASWKKMRATMSAEERDDLDHCKAGHKRISGSVVMSNADGCVLSDYGQSPPVFFLLCNSAAIADGEQLRTWVVDAPIYERGGRKLKCDRAVK